MTRIRSGSITSKRLQVSIEEQELQEIQRAARRDRLTVAEWVRQALREVRQLRAQATIEQARGDPQGICVLCSHGRPRPDAGRDRAWGRDLNSQWGCSGPAVVYSRILFSPARPSKPAS